MRVVFSKQQRALFYVVLPTCCYLAVWGLCLAPGFAQTVVGEIASHTKDSSEASLKLASIFSDRMVLQRDRPIPIWGHATANALVKVQLGEHSQETKADAMGRWRLDMPALPVGGPWTMQVSSDRDALQVSDILIGEVWIASGQSNMQWSVEKSNDAEQVIAAANWPKIRLITLPRQAAQEPSDSFKSYGWHVCSPKSVKKFSAVAYHFGRDLHKKLHVPIGLVSTNYGGTPMEAWTSQTALASKSDFSWAAQKAKDPISSDWKVAKSHPSALYNAMVHPLIPFSMRGVIWYQGESNADRHKHYHQLSELMIADWRERWGQGDFPFLLVQLAGWRETAETWPYLREAQQRTVQTVTNTAMAIATDIGAQRDIHPRNKQDVGKRLALLAREMAYNEHLVCSGPVYRKMTIIAGKAYLDFTDVSSGLQGGKGGTVGAGQELKGFVIAGADRKFVPAKAKIEGEQVIVSSIQVPQPVAVRYNWAGWTEGNLYNIEGLPAAPFRTDQY